MPIYEYVCDDCRRVASLFFRSYSQVTEAACPHCSGSNLRRLVSKVIILKGEAKRAQELDVRRELAGLNPMDPSSVAHWAREKGSELDPLLGSNLREMAEKMESGDTPTEMYDPAYYFKYAVEHKQQLMEEAGHAQEPPSLADQMGRPDLGDPGSEA